MVTQPGRWLKDRRRRCSVANVESADICFYVQSKLLFYLPLVSLTLPNSETYLALNMQVQKEAIIRLKRPLEDSPLDTLILNCNKKRKLDAPTGASTSDLEPLVTILKFTGTQHSQDEDISKHVKDFKNNLKDKLSYGLKKHNVDFNSKLRAEAIKNSKDSRYKVINYLRSNVITDKYNNENLIIYDLEASGEFGCDDKKPDQKFVYDLYCADTNLLEDADDYNISIFPTSESLVFDSDDVYNIDEEDDDSEDSNAENNRRNDYPDESDNDSINEDDLVQAVRNVDLDDTLSSEDELDYSNEEYNDEVYNDDLEEDEYLNFIAENENCSELQEENSLILTDLCNDYYL
ncbi:hypothetical protein WA026_006616 [Henosepilachna vigintioctopunctata]|uniref:Probable RNA polymerase II nuclear localization protein SLC7A6OS n=1 Tax=Henosepilachna vigintioctopunctata TaxID=420089 RepID=A0AAW1UFH0_9CUCU